jgi:hypothetical protein
MYWLRRKRPQKPTMKHMTDFYSWRYAGRCQDSLKSGETEEVARRFSSRKETVEHCSRQEDSSFCCKIYHFGVKYCPRQEYFFASGKVCSFGVKRCPRQGPFASKFFFQEGEVLPKIFSLDENILLRREVLFTDRKKVER